MVVNTPEPAYLLLAEVCYPGWQAFIDGTPAPIYRANTAFRAVYLPEPGEHTVLLAFRPPSVIVGLALTGLDFELGAGDVNIDFAEPNAASMAVMRVRTGAGSLNLTGLANANADEIALDSGAGDFQLAFDGDLQQDMVVEVDAGAGRVVITVPAGVNAEVRANEGLVVRVTAQGDWTRERSGVYTLAGDADGHKLSFDVEAGVGEIVLRTA